MADLEQTLGTILNNPQLMQQIMSLAQSLGTQEPPPAAQPENPGKNPLAGIDPAVLAKLASFAGNTGVDSDQQALLQALCPYISQPKVGKLEKAMRAAKMARMASGFLGQGGLSLLTGR